MAATASCARACRSAESDPSNVPSVVAERMAIGLPFEVTTRSFSCARDRHTSSDWLRHDGCRFAYTPRSRVRFGTEKFRQNVARDRRTEDALRSLGWRVLKNWECETRGDAVVAHRLKRSCAPPISMVAVMETEAIRGIDIFCGAGGSSAGARAAGVEIVAGVDMCSTKHAMRAY